jgi:hypothetical protein
MLNHHTRRLVLTLAAAAVLAVPLSGCGAVAEKAIEEATGGKVDIKDGGKDVKIKGPDGQELEFGSGAKLPTDWPSDVPIPEGATILGSGSFSESGSEGAKNVSIETTQQPGALLESMKSSLESNGWTVKTETSAAQGGTIAAEKGANPTRNVVVFVTGETDGKTVAAITVANSSS